MEGPVARGRLHRHLHRHLDLERALARQAEARLRQHLQRLERACRYHLRLLSWEQRQLRREGERLQRHIRSERPPSFGKGSQPRPGHAAACRTQGERGGAPRASGRRAPAATTPTRGTHEEGSREPPSHHTGLRDPVGSRGSSPSQSSAASDVTEEEPADLAASAEPAHADLGAGPAGDLGGACGEEARSGDAAPQPDRGTGGPASPRATGCEGGPDSQPPLLQLFARAADARYLRHRVAPEAERVLSLAEIFGRGGPAAQGGAASRSPPL